MNERAQAILDAARKAEAEVGGSVGIRVLHGDENPAVGDTLAESVVWEDGERTNKALGGTAVFYPTEIGARQAANYVSTNSRIAIVSGDTDMGSCGMPEPHAFILRGAEVVDIME